MKVRKGQGVAILNFGALLDQALEAAETLDATVIDMRWVKPMDEALVLEMAASHELIVTLEENAAAGGAGSAVQELLQANGVATPVAVIGIPDDFQEHGDQNALRALAGLSAEGVCGVVGVSCRRAY